MVVPFSIEIMLDDDSFLNDIASVGEKASSNKSRCLASIIVKVSPVPKFVNVVCDRRASVGNTFIKDSWPLEYELRDLHDSTEYVVTRKAIDSVLELSSVVNN